MLIKDSKTIREIQAEFNKLFPGLKLEFYKKAHSHHKGSKIENQYDPNLKIKDIRSQHNQGDLKIDPEMKVSELESEFEKKFGLHAQVFRRSNALWLQTIKTDGWTLEVQNRKGMHSVQPE